MAQYRIRNTDKVVKVLKEKKKKKSLQISSLLKKTRKKNLIFVYWKKKKKKTQGRGNNIIHWFNEAFFPVVSFQYEFCFDFLDEEKQ